jgi:FkbM family methyltransferase
MKVIGKVIRRLQSYGRRAKNLLGTICHLRNWQQLRRQQKLVRRGEVVTGRPVLRFRSGLRITLVPASYEEWDFLFREIFLDKCYQPTPDFIPRPGWTVVDLGANMGFFTCQTGFANPDVRVVAVEPLPLYAEILRNNIQDNHLKNALAIEGAICGDPDLTIPITVWFTAAGELRTGEIPKTAARVETINAKGYTLPEIFRLGNVGCCDLLKVDIEGAEYDLFEKIPGEIWDKIFRVVMEVHKDGGRSESEIVRLLEQKGFVVSLKDASSNNPMLWAVKSGR